MGTSFHRIHELPSPYGYAGDLSGEAAIQGSLARRARNTDTPPYSLFLPSGQHDLSNCSARLDPAMDVAEVVRIDLRNHLGEGRSNKLVID